MGVVEPYRFGTSDAALIDDGPGVMDPYRVTAGNTEFVDLGPDPNLWRDVPWGHIGDYEHVHVMTAILDHLNCTLQSRIEPGKGKVWRLAPKP